MPNSSSEASQDVELFLFTDAYPFGSQESFVALELPYLLERFPRIHVFPRSTGDNPSPRDVPEGVTVAPPLFSGDHRSQRTLLGLLNTAPIFPILRACIRDRLFSTPGRMVRGIEAFITIRYILSRPFISNINLQKKPVWYFYWGSGWAWALPFLRHPVRSVCRFHGFDLYETRTDNRGCTPLQKDILQTTQLGAPISDHGFKYLQTRHPEVSEKLVTHRLGVPEMPSARASTDGVFRILSCSRAVPLKRLDLLARAVLKFSTPVMWTHIGDGSTLDEVKKLMKSSSPHITTNFTGQLSYEQMQQIYQHQPVDLFVLVSESEGLPVSIMEALSAGVPVLATDVGGISELIDSSVGSLLPAELDDEVLHNALNAIQQDSAQRSLWASNAKLRWRERVDAAQNFRAFADAVTQL